MGSNPAEGNGFLRAIKICSMPSFREKVNLSAPCCKILWHVKKTSSMNKDTRTNLSFPSPVLPALLLDDSFGRIARELWWTNQKFSPVSIIPPWFSMLIYHMGNEQ
jgi:hypothetical protein